MLLSHSYHVRIMIMFLLCFDHVLIILLSHSYLVRIMIMFLLCFDHVLIMLLSHLYHVRIMTIFCYALVISISNFTNSSLPRVRRLLPQWWSQKVEGINDAPKCRKIVQAHFKLNVIICCSLLLFFYVILCYSVLFYAILCCTMLFCVVLRCFILFHVAFCDLMSI